ncbi:MAG: NADH-quinone oxidoreductase subunit NuoE [Candidatus Hecatellaceae archaeon]
MVRLNCRHCGYVWDYQGVGEYYATCPRCRYKVRIPQTGLREVKGGMKRSVIPMKEEQPVRLFGIAGLVNKVVEEYQYKGDMLIQILLKLQRGLGWLPMEALMEVSKQLNIPLGRVYRVATFYKAFSLAPRGRNLIRVCTGTSCMVRGAQMILDRLTSLLGIGPGETAPDLKFTLETVNCLGCCALGPVITINDTYYGNLTPASVTKIIEKIKGGGLE